MNPLEILETIGKVIWDCFVPGWRLLICLVVGVGLGLLILQLVPQEPLRWILASGAVLFVLYLGRRSDRGVS